MKKIWKKVINLIHSLFYGMSNADQIVFQSSSIDNNGISIIKEQTENRVSKDLLKGEVTQAVEELRYRTYLVDREAKNYEYYSPTLAKKRDIDDIKDIFVENSENLTIVTVQPNTPDMGTILDAIDRYESGKGVQLKSSYTIKCNRKDLVPRFNIEEFTTLLVVKVIDESKKQYELDFYVPIYENPYDFRSRSFLSEIKKIQENNIKTDLFDIESIEFITSHAYNINDMIKFKFNNIKFKNIVEFDGNYVVKLSSTLIDKPHDILDDYYSPTMDEKYKKKVKKDIVYDVNGGDVRKEYICEHCGKIIVYDTEEINSAIIGQARDIDEEQIESNLSNYFDLQIAEQTFGKKLCKDCLNEYLKKENNNIVDAK